MTTVDIGETEVMTALRAFIVGLLDCEVVQAVVNGVAMPIGGFIALTSMGATRLSTTIVTYKDGASEETRVQRFEQPSRWGVQIDCYGPDANRWSSILRATLITPYAVTKFGRSVVPLTVSEARHLPVINGEAQFERRWSFDVALQINQIVALPQQFFDNAEIETIEVDERYPAIE